MIKLLNIHPYYHIISSLSSNAFIIINMRETEQKKGRYSTFTFVKFVHHMFFSGDEPQPEQETRNITTLL